MGEWVFSLAYARCDRSRVVTISSDLWVYLYVAGSNRGEEKWTHNWSSRNSPGEIVSSEALGRGLVDDPKRPGLNELSVKWQTHADLN